MFAERGQTPHRHSSAHCNTVTTLASTVPANGDVNPYGVAVVPRSTGHLHRGNVLVSNFNDKANVQGTGTTIVQVTPSGQRVAVRPDHGTPGRACPGGVGLTTALAVLRSGWVIVGSLPTAERRHPRPAAGCLIVLDSEGKVRETFTGHGINGPWDMTALDRGGIADAVRDQRAERHGRGGRQHRQRRHGAAAA